MESSGIIKISSSVLFEGLVVILVVLANAKNLFPLFARNN